MYIKSLTLKDYRSYGSEKLEFCENVNILVGKNAQGKTNVLEAIFFMIVGKSFKTSKEKEIIAWEKDNAYIKGEFEKRYREVKIEMFFDKNSKKSNKTSCEKSRNKKSNYTKNNILYKFIIYTFSKFCF